MRFKEIVKPVRKLSTTENLAVRLMDRIQSRWFQELSEEDKLLLIDVLTYLENKLRRKE